MALSRLTDQLGRVLSGRYRLMAPIGSGASALVYLADDTKLRRRVAVKLLAEGLTSDEPFLRRFRAEAQAAASLHHPHIVSVFDWGEDGGEPYLVTEYLGGGSIASMLDHGHRLDPAQALLVGLEAARALDHAHKRGFVHRDIKPGNLLFGEDARLRVADFGLARALAEAAWTEPTGAMLGTARYACPEIARGEPVDGRGDIYSLGLVLIEAITGVVPFATDTTVSTMTARADTPVPVPEAVGPLRRALQAAGQPDPNQRPDAAEFSTLLMAAAEQLSRPAPLPLVPLQASATAAGVEDHTMLPQVLRAAGAVGGAEAPLDDVLDPDAKVLPAAAPGAGTGEADDAAGSDEAAGAAADPDGPPEADDLADATGALSAAELRADDLVDQRDLDDEVPSWVGEGRSLAQPVEDADADGADGSDAEDGADAVDPSRPAGDDDADGADEGRDERREDGDDGPGGLGSMPAALATTAIPRWQDGPDEPLDEDRTVVAAIPALDVPPPAPAAGAPSETSAEVSPKARRKADKAAAKAAKAEAKSRAKAERGAGRDPSRRRRRWPWVVLVVVLLAALGTGGVVAYNTLAVPSHEVPVLTGLTEEQAQALIGESKWTVERAEGREDGTQPGSVIAQDPPPGTSLKEKKAVSITVSLGNTLVVVPTEELAGKSFDEAKALLEGTSLLVGERTDEFSEDVGSGVVIAVAEGTPSELPKQESVDLIVSKGPRPRQVPAPAATYDATVAALAAVQLQATKAEEHSETVPQGGIIGLRPGAGAEVPRGSTVTVVVSAGPQPVTVPNLRGRPMAQAVAALEAAGLRADARGSGVVLYTYPEQGASVRKGTTITLFSL